MKGHPSYSMKSLVIDLGIRSKKSLTASKCDDRFSISPIMLLRTFATSEASQIPPFEDSFLESLFINEW
jgi:hypothetical protein